MNNFAIQPVRRAQRGATAVIFAVMAVFLFGAMAFSIDLGRVYNVRYEMQNAADLESLAVAAVLYPPPDPATGVPNWARAETIAASAVGLNKSEGVTLNASTIKLGYWNVVTRTGTWGKPPVPPGPNELPAVQVTVARDTAGSNSGPVSMTFGRLLGLSEFPVSATAIAVISIPASVGPGALAPYAMSKCTYESYWDSTNGKPLGDANGVFEIVLGNKNECSAPSCSCGQWTSLDVDNNSASYVKGLIDNGNPSTLNIGNNIWIQPGTQSTAFGDFNSLVGKAITIPVVDAIACDLSNKGECPIIAFGCFRVDYAVQGGAKSQCQTGAGQSPPITRTYVNPLDDNKCIVGRFEAGTCKVPGGTGVGGTYYGTYVPPRIAQ